MITDSFTYTATETLAAQDNWEQGLGDIICNGSSVYCNSVRAIAYNTLESGTDQRTRATRTQVGGAGYGGVAVRCSPNNGYIFVVGTFTAYIARIVDGTSTILVQENIDYQETSIVELVASGTTLQGFINGFLVCEVIDSTFASGYPGVAGRNADSTTVIDNFVAQTANSVFTGTATLTGSYFNIVRSIGNFLIGRNNTWTFTITRNT